MEGTKLGGKEKFIDIGNDRKNKRQKKVRAGKICGQSRGDSFPSMFRFRQDSFSEKKGAGTHGQKKGGVIN